MTRLLISEHPLLVLPSLAQAVGLNEAIILQQIHYWLDSRTNKNFKEGKYWVYNTYGQWKEQFPFLSEITIKRSILSLEKLGLLISKNLNSNTFNKSKWYTINYKKLLEIEKNLTIKNQADPGVQSDCLRRSNRVDHFDTLERSNRYDDDLNLIQSNNKETETTTKTTTNSFTNSENIAQKMIHIWNEVTGESEKIVLSKHLSKKLVVSFNKLFNKDLEKWMEYCKKILKIRYLNGNTGFKATILWCLESKNYIKVTEGYYPNEDKPELAVSNKESLEYLIHEVEILDVPYFWKQTKLNLLHQFGRDTYLSWFRKLNLTKFENGILTLQVSSKFISEYLEQHFKQKIQKTCEAFNAEVKKIKIEY